MWDSVAGTDAYRLPRRGGTSRDHPVVRSWGHTRGKPLAKGTSMPNLKPLLFVVLAAGCGLRKDQTNVDSAEMAVDSSESVESEGNMMMASVDGADMVALAAYTPDQVAARIAANAATRWQPTGCATVTQSGANVTIVFNDCTGPRGLLHVTGELDLVVSVALDGTISVHGTATDLQVNLATISVDANAVYTVSGTSHSVAVETT